MSPTEYDADNFFWKKFIFFWRHWSTTVASLEHNCHIFGTQRPHVWNTTVTSLEHNVLAVWRGGWLQHYDRSNLLMRPEQLSLNLGWKFIKTENSGSIVGLLGKIPVTLLWLQRTTFQDFWILYRIKDKSCWWIRLLELNPSLITLIMICN